MLKEVARIGIIRKLLLLAIVLVVASKMFAGDDKSSVVVGISEQASNVKQKTVVYQAHGWEYLEPTDEITGKAYQYARIKSDSSLSLGRPNAGANYGTLAVRQHPQYGLDMFVSIDRGQILWLGDSYWKCAFKIRFDDVEVEKFSALRALDGSSTVVFAQYPKWAIGKLKAAKTIKV